MNKLHELQLAVELYNVKIICITESHFSIEINDAEIQLNNFNLFRCDRKNGKAGGGSCIFVHKTMEAEYIHDFIAPDSVGVSVKVRNQLINFFLCL